MPLSLDRIPVSTRWCRPTGGSFLLGTHRRNRQGAQRERDTVHEIGQPVCLMHHSGTPSPFLMPLPGVVQVPLEHLAQRRGGGPSRMALWCNGLSRMRDQFKSARVDLSGTLARWTAAELCDALYH